MVRVGGSSLFGHEIAELAHSPNKSVIDLMFSADLKFQVVFTLKATGIANFCKGIFAKESLHKNLCTIGSGLHNW